MSIKKISGKITNIIDLTKSAKEVEITLSEPLDFVSGAFVNLFIDIDGEKIRRAYSISSSDKEKKNITLAIRLLSEGKMSPLFWNRDMRGTEVELMGPLGLNTADKMNASKIYLFGFGIGTGVIKSVAEHLITQQKFESMVIITGSRFEDEIVYRSFFDDLAKASPKIKSLHAISRGDNLPEDTKICRGYIQDHLEQFDFNNSDVYVCGQKTACDCVVDKIKSFNPQNCNFLLEAFS